MNLLFALLFAIDVTDFGADPTGKADSTAAIQKAVNAALWVNSTVDDKNPNSFVQAQTSPTVVFPWGKYRITDTIKLLPVVTVRGEDAIIRQYGQGKSIFDCSRAGTIVRISGMKFVGGTTAIQISNQNVNGTMITIRDCTFDDQTSTSIIVKAEGGDGHMSCLMVIDSCRYRAKGEFLESWCDLTKVTNSWVQWGASPFGGCITNNGNRMVIEHCMFVPDQANTSQYWIRNKGNLHALHTRFSGETGGLPILIQTDNLISKYTQSGAVTTFDKCQLSAGQNPKFNPNSAIVTGINTVPSLISIDACSELIEVPWLQVKGSAAATAGTFTIPMIIRTGRNENWPLTVRVPKDFTKYIVP